MKYTISILFTFVCFSAFPQSIRIPLHELEEAGDSGYIIRANALGDAEWYEITEYNGDTVIVWNPTLKKFAFIHKDSLLPSNNVTGSGTTNYLTKFTSSSTIGNANMTDNGTILDALLPLRLKSYTTAGLPVSSGGHTVYNSTASNIAFGGVSTWEYPVKSASSTGVGTNTYVGYFDSNGRLTGSTGFQFNGSNVVTLLGGGVGSFRIGINHNFVSDNAATAGGLVLRASTYSSSARVLRLPSSLDVTTGGIIFFPTSDTETTSSALKISSARTIRNTSAIDNQANVSITGSSAAAYSYNSVQTVTPDAVNNITGSVFGAIRAAQTFNSTARIAGNAKTLFYGVHVQPNITRGTGNDTTSIGIMIDPTLSGTTQFEGIRMTNTVGKGINQISTTPTNILAGNTIIGSTSTPTQDLHVDGNQRLVGALYDSNNEAGTFGQLLSSTGAATDWIDAPAGYTGWYYDDGSTVNEVASGDTLTVVPDGDGIYSGSGTIPSDIGIEGLNSRFISFNNLSNLWFYNTSASTGNFALQTIVKDGGLALVDNQTIFQRRIQARRSTGLSTRFEERFFQVGDSTNRSAGWTFGFSGSSTGGDYTQMKLWTQPGVNQHYLILGEGATNFDNTNISDNGGVVVVSSTSVPALTVRTVSDKIAEFATDGTITFNDYDGTKTASALGKTESGYILGLATDNTVIAIPDSTLKKHIITRTIYDGDAALPDSTVAVNGTFNAGFWRVPESMDGYTLTKASFGIFDKGDMSTSGATYSFGVQKCNGSNMSCSNSSNVNFTPSSETELELTLSITLNANDIIRVNYQPPQGCGGGCGTENVNGLVVTYTIQEN